MGKWKKWRIVTGRFPPGIIFLTSGVITFVQCIQLSGLQQSGIVRRFLSVLKEPVYSCQVAGIVIRSALALFSNGSFLLILIVMFPVDISGILFHLRLNIQMVPAAVVIGFIQVYLIYISREKYLLMLIKRINDIKI